MLVIAAGTFAVFLLSRVRATDGGAVTFRDFLRGKFDTLTGPVRGWEALLHVILAPAAMSSRHPGDGVYRERVAYRVLARGRRPLALLRD